eukprot:601401-Amphidinium_carterae.1
MVGRGWSKGYVKLMGRTAQHGVGVRWTSNNMIIATSADKMYLGAVERPDGSVLRQIASKKDRT